MTKTKHNDGGSAFPTQVMMNAPMGSLHQNYGGTSTGTAYAAWTGGMSMRDFFACVALPKAIGGAAVMGEADINRLMPGSHTVTREELAARLAYQMADAMLAERTKAEGR